MLKFKKLYKDAQLPVYATPGAACFDFFAYNEFVTAANNVEVRMIHVIAKNLPTVISTKLSVEIPPGKVMLLFSRSGHGFKNDTRLANCVGVIDSDYRGEIKCKLTNDNELNEPLRVHHGDRIMQGMIVDCPQQQIVEVDELSETERGEGGFGSTDTLANFKVGKALTKKSLNEINDERFKQRIDSMLKE